ncbi:MAG TPA: hypothetical protein VHV55_17170, partial [Pirellulales bacterium]|nr:hypothetical protein [Pirellulales bacterium]
MTGVAAQYLEQPNWLFFRRAGAPATRKSWPACALRSDPHPHLAWQIPFRGAHVVGLGARDHRHPAAIPKSKPQRDVAGRHYLTKPEINALYFATHKMRRPRGWRGAIPVGRYWRSALVLFFNYGFDTGTIWKSAPFHEPILWRHVFWRRQSPDRDLKENSRW